ncbi:MAG: hypothetical protein GY822_10890 [Deltaproteobacteria bacterium]|nr:hypothetical protein [Deltaproteobacteria bacterium]
MSRTEDGLLIAGAYGLQAASDDDFSLLSLREESALPGAGRQITNDSVAAKLGENWIHAGHGIRIYNAFDINDDVEEFISTGNARLYSSTTGVQSVLGDDLVFSDINEA